MHRFLPFRNPWSNSDIIGIVIIEQQWKFKRSRANISLQLTLSLFSTFLKILILRLLYLWIWTWDGGWRLSRRGRRRFGRTRTRSWSAATSLHTADISAPWGCKDNKCTVGIEPAAYRRWRWLLRRAWPRCTPGGPPAPGTSGSSWWCSAAPWIVELQT